MEYIFDNDLHIHSQISLCSSDPQQTTDRILAYAKENNLNTICLTDHFWDETIPGASNWYKKQNYNWICQAKPLPQTEGIRFLFGCEIDMDKHLTLGLARVHFDRFDFVVIPTTHLHMTGFTISKEDGETATGRAKLWVERLDALLAMDLPFEKIGIAHLACPLIDNRSRQAYLSVLAHIPETELRRLFAKAAALGVGIELNQTDMDFSDEETDIVLRPFRIAKGCGCKFYFGSDAHHPQELDSAKAIFERAVALLGLEESDKFVI